MEVANTRAYYGTATITTIKSFISTGSQCFKMWMSGIEEMNTKFKNRGKNKIVLIFLFCFAEQQRLQNFLEIRNDQTNRLTD
jgi:hypothetical protein